MALLRTRRYTRSWFIVDHQLIEMLFLDAYKIATNMNPGHARSKMISRVPVAIWAQQLFVCSARFYWPLQLFYWPLQLPCNDFEPISVQWLPTERFESAAAATARRTCKKPDTATTRPSTNNVGVRASSSTPPSPVSCGRHHHHHQLRVDATTSPCTATIRPTTLVDATLVC